MTHKWASIAGATVACVLTAATSAVAGARQTAPAVIHACVGKGGVLAVAGRNGCGGRTLAWGVAGPRGAKGARGARGARGAAGPEGPQGITGPQGPTGAPATTAVASDFSTVDPIAVNKGTTVATTTVNDPTGTGNVVVWATGSSDVTNQQDAVACRLYIGGSVAGNPAFPTISPTLTPFSITAMAPAAAGPNVVSLVCGSADGTGKVGYVNLVAFAAG